MLAVTGACVSGPALSSVCFDHVVMTEDAFAYVTGPDSVAEFTGVRVRGPSSVARRCTAGSTGVAVTRRGRRADAARRARGAALVPPRPHLDDPPRWATDDAATARVHGRGGASPSARPRRTTSAPSIEDVLDAESLPRAPAAYAPNLVTGSARSTAARSASSPTSPCTAPGTLDIDASRKAARFVAWCDAFNLPIVTFVDTPGFEPGNDLEWRGMIRHGAQLVHAYAAATVPRLCVVLRKAYGGAYIVMDSRGIGNDLCVAWPGAEIAVMGAAPARCRSSRRRPRATTRRARRRAELVEEYEARSTTRTGRRSAGSSTR